MRPKQKHVTIAGQTDSSVGLMDWNVFPDAEFTNWPLINSWVMWPMGIFALSVIGQRQQCFITMPRNITQHNGGSGRGMRGPGPRMDVMTARRIRQGVWSDRGVRAGQRGRRTIITN